MGVLGLYSWKYFFTSLSFSLYPMSLPYEFWNMNMAPAVAPIVAAVAAAGPRMGLPVT